LAVREQMQKNVGYTCPLHFCTDRISKPALVMITALPCGEGMTFYGSKYWSHETNKL